MLTGKSPKNCRSQIIRSFKPKSPEQYLSNSHQNGGADVIAVAELPLEFIMNHLRLKQGFTLEAYQAATGLAVATLEPALSDLRETKLAYPAK